MKEYVAAVMVLKVTFTHLSLLLHGFLSQISTLDLYSAYDLI